MDIPLDARGSQLSATKQVVKRPIVEALDFSLAIVVAVAVKAIGTNGDSKRLIHIVILEGQRLVGDALEALLNRQPDMDVVANLDFASVSTLNAASAPPDIAIVDFAADVAAATDAAAELRRAGCDAPMIAISDSSASYQIALAAIEAEACVIISGSESATGLVHAVRMASTGISLMQPAIVASILSDRRVREASLRRFTRREMEVLRLLSHGTSSRQIAKALGIRYLTVRTHMRNLAGKLAAHSKLEILARAYELELIASPGGPRRSSAATQSDLDD